MQRIVPMTTILLKVTQDKQKHINIQGKTRQDTHTQKLQALRLYTTSGTQSTPGSQDRILSNFYCASRINRE